MVKSTNIGIFNLNLMRLIQQPVPPGILFVIVFVIPGGYHPHGSANITPAAAAAAAAVLVAETTIYKSYNAACNRACLLKSRSFTRQLKTNNQTTTDLSRRVMFLPLLRNRTWTSADENPHPNYHGLITPRIRRYAGRRSVPAAVTRRH